jgi:hypothetical protein
VERLRIVLDYLFRSLGKGPGLTLVGLLQTGLGYSLALAGKDLSGFAYVVGAVNVGLFGGGAIKAHAEAKANGTRGTTPVL